MGRVFDHIKGYAEDQLIDRLRYRDYRQRVIEDMIRHIYADPTPFSQLTVKR